MDRRQKPRRNPHMVLGSYIGVTLPAPHLSEPLHGSAPEVAQEAPRIAPLPGVRGLAVRPKHAPVNALRRVGGEVRLKHAPVNALRRVGGEVRLKHAPERASWRIGSGGSVWSKYKGRARFYSQPRALTSRVW